MHALVESDLPEQKRDDVGDLFWCSHSAKCDLFRLLRHGFWAGNNARVCIARNVSYRV